MKKLLFIMLFICLGNNFVQAELVKEEMVYEIDGRQFKGYLVYEGATPGKRPGILVVHEWWGHNTYARMRADMLAQLGYTAFALDMYGDGKVAGHPEDAGAFSSEVMSRMDEVGLERFEAAMGILQNHETVLPDKIAAIGYCFGGSTVLHMARFGLDLKGVVSFHGGLGTKYPAQPGEVKAKILVCQGGADSMVPQEDVENFRNEMDVAEASYEIKIYPGAKHSFTNPQADQFAKQFGINLGYNLEADKESWKDMKVFLKGLF